MIIVNVHTMNELGILLKDLSNQSCGISELYCSDGVDEEISGDRFVGMAGELLSTLKSFDENYLDDNERAMLHTFNSYHIYTKNEWMQYCIQELEPEQYPMYLIQWISKQSTCSV